MRRQLAIIVLSAISLSTVVATRAHAQEPRVLIGVDFAHFVSNQDEQAFAFTSPLFRETSAVSAAYPKLPGVSGVLPSVVFGIRRGIAVGIHSDQEKYESTVGLGLVVPSPFFFNTLAVAGNVTASTLEREDFALDVQVQYVRPIGRDVILRVFGGPTIFHLSNQLVEVVLFSQIASPVLPINVVTITGFTQKEVSGNALGFNVGTDVAYFFLPHVGVGGGVSHNRGTVSVTEPLTLKSADFKMGHTIVNGGLRLRF